MADFIYAISTLFEGEKRDTSPARPQGYTKSCDTSTRPIGENASDNEIRLWVSRGESPGLAFDPEPRGRLRHWGVWFNTPSTESGLCIFAFPWPFLINMQMTCGPEVGSSQSQSDSRRAGNGRVSKLTGSDVACGDNLGRVQNLQKEDWMGLSNIFVKNVCFEYMPIYFSDFT